jgi:nucleoside-diphosphate-sugar epimerase
MTSSRASRRPSPGTGSTLSERILVTGAAGFLGSHTVRRLLRRGDEVVALVRPQSDLRRLEDLRGDIDLRELDLVGGGSIGVNRVDRVLHLAAAGIGGTASAETIVATNVLGTLRALELATAAGAATFLYCGSCFEYGPGEGHGEDDRPRPISAYGASKTGGWLLAQAYGLQHRLEVTGVRPFTVYGPYEAASRLIPSVCLGAIHGETVELTQGTQTRDFVFVDDAVDAIILASADHRPQTYNVCTGSSTSVREVAEEVANLTGREVDLRFGALPPRLVELQVLSGDPTLARDMLGWSATTSLRDGLERTFEWFEERHNERAKTVGRTRP